jgi:hypothetical protein
MSDRGSRREDADSSPETELETWELRSRSVAEARFQRERRASETPARPGPAVRWKAPAEMGGERPARSLLRLVAFLGVLTAAYAGVRYLTDRLFAPRLSVLGPSVPAEAVTPGEPVTLGLNVRNERSRDGAAYAVLILPNGSEVEGPVVMVPGRDSVLVPVQAAFPPGDHTTSLLLFDAWRDNVEIAAAHGVRVRSGRTRVDVTSAAVSATPGDSVIVSFELANAAAWDSDVVPLVVFTPGPSGRLQREAVPAVEVGLPVAHLSAGETLARRHTIEPGAVPPGRYLVAVLAVTPEGEPAGAGVHGIPFAVGGGR